ncbi:MAG: hypothetical protein Kow009_00210 [Spirochaetales bacterium]
MDCERSSTRSVARLMESMAEEVNRVRKEKGLSVERLAQKVGMHRNTLFRILNGQVDPRITEMNRLYMSLEAQGVSLEQGRFRFLCIGGTPVQAMDIPPSEYMLQEMGRVIQERRIALRASQETLAEWADLHRNTIGKIERGEMDMSLSTLFRIYTVLGITKVFLQEGKLVLL